MPASAGSDDYFIRFFSASYDKSGGTVLGARLEVNSFGVVVFSARRRLLAEGDYAIDQSPWFQKALAADKSGVVQTCVEINQCVGYEASRRWRGGRRDDSARTCRKI